MTNEVAEVLERGVKILFFNGMNDIICNHVGNERMIENLSWSKIDQWNVADRYIWRAGGKPPAGYMREFQNLQFLKIREAGHMVRVYSTTISASLFVGHLVFFYQVYLVCMLTRCQWTSLSCQ